MKPAVGLAPRQFLWSTATGRRSGLPVVPPLHSGMQEFLRDAQVQCHYRQMQPGPALRFRMPAQSHPSDGL